MTDKVTKTKVKTTKGRTTRSGAGKGMSPVKKRSTTAAGRTKQNRSSGPGMAAKAGPGRGQKVLRIFRFAQRFELKDKDRHCRKSGLFYTKDFATISGDEAIGYKQQFDLLSNDDGCEYCMFYGIYRQLVNLTARQSRAYRGYLLDADKQPLSDSQIAKLLRIETKKMSKFLKRFAGVRLLEKVEMPEFDLSENEPPEDDTSTDSDTKPPCSGKKTKRGTSAHKCGQSAGKVRTSAGKVRTSAGKVRSAFKKEKDKRNSKPEGLNGNSKPKEITDLNKNPNKTNANQEHEANESLEPESKAQQQKRALIPTQSQNSVHKPENPKESEAAAVKGHHIPKQPSSAYRGGKPQSIGHIISGMFPGHWQDVDCEAFGWDVVRALGYQTDAGNMDARSEWGAFASWLSRLKRAAPSAAEELKTIAVEKAEYVRKRAKSARNKSAVWFKVMEGVLSSRGITLQPARASPA